VKGIYIQQAVAAL